MAHSKILQAHEGPLSIVKFNDPEYLNAVDKRMAAQFADVMQRLLEDKTVRAILLTGEGRSFCSGANLKEMFGEQMHGNIPDVGTRLRTFINPILMQMKQSIKPIIAAVNGPAVGVGCGIALAADLVLVARSAYFFQSFVHLGVVPDGGSSWSIPRLAGNGRAAAMMMLGEKIDAETAVAWGLAYRMFEDSELTNAAHEMATRLAHGPTFAYGKIKELLRESDANGFSNQLEAEAAHQVEAFASQDCREGIAAFNQKRAPNFKGR